MLPQQRHGDRRGRRPLRRDRRSVSSREPACHGLSVRGQRNVRPTGVPVWERPLGFGVADQVETRKFCAAGDHVPAIPLRGGRRSRLPPGNVSREVAAEPGEEGEFRPESRSFRPISVPLVLPGRRSKTMSGWSLRQRRATSRSPGRAASSSRIRASGESRSNRLSAAPRT